MSDYELSADAEVTVLLYSKRVVRGNHAFRTGELTDRAINAVIGDVGKHFAGK